MGQSLKYLCRLCRNLKKQIQSYSNESHSKNFYQFLWGYWWLISKKEEEKCIHLNNACTKILEIPTLEFYKSLKTVLFYVTFGPIFSSYYHISGTSPGNTETNLTKACNKG